jgi:hypothetical protein
LDLKRPGQGAVSKPQPGRSCAKGMTHTWQVGRFFPSSTMLIGGARVSALQAIRLSARPLPAGRESVQAQDERHHEPDGEGGNGKSNTQTQHRAQEPRKNGRIDAGGKRPIKQVSISSWISHWAETFVHHVTSRGHHDGLGKQSSEAEMLSCARVASPTGAAGPGSIPRSC